ncbi:NAD(P)/FAD-dependent oxidoreductase [Tatumella citrea]|uniref:FAD dependent oxidoreductase domain-containing protein n=1 Tax=Tatumella citrea TaxID=53336 RepID=A0A1Y0L2T9_TATCI|nr:FAD-binding oxidoreductase [Tatumella citrea]ARU92322.1 hypothetical protein A7K98_00025 [Tatumella citrea]ARU96357.1 hypothetical protein A7K99_00025 [Tatumella citrea]
MKVAVIGGGVIGVSCAHQLVKAGAEVTLFTEEMWASEASGRSLSWLNASGPWPESYYLLRMAGIARYQELFHRLSPIDWLKFSGGIFWSRPEEVAEWHQAETDHGYQSVLLNDPQQLAAIEALANPEAINGTALFNPGEGWVSLPELINTLLAEFIALGGKTVQQAGKVLPSADIEGRICGVITPEDGLLPFDRVLVACGAETPAVVGSLGYSLPDGSVLSMLAITEPADALPEKVFNTPRVALRPNPGQTLALDHSWYVDDICQQQDGSFTLSPQIPDRLLEEADRILSLEAPLKVASYKAGRKPVPADGFPVLGELPGFPGCFIAFTHSGATLALIIGELLAGEMMTDKRHPMLADFRPERFIRQ